VDVGSDEFKRLDNRASWIEFKRDGDNEDGNDAAPPETAPVVIQFDEATGQQKNQQEHFAARKETAEAKIKLPWKDWYNDIGSNLGHVEAEKASAVAVLHGIHKRFDVSKERVEVWSLKGRTSVTASEAVAPHTIYLPPCNPKQSKVFENSEHPFTVPIKVVEFQNEDAAEGRASKETGRTVTYFVNPEFKAPESIPARVPAVADAEEAAVTAVADTWAWGPRGQEVMHPFWAVRRMTAKQLAQHNSREPVPLRFNCVLELFVNSAVSVGVLRGQSLNSTRTVQVPILTNNVKLEEGEELVLEISDKPLIPARNTTKRRWVSAFKESENDIKSKKREAIVKSLTATGTRGT
jgi:hypothetical protein